MVKRSTTNSTMRFREDEYLLIKLSQRTYKLYRRNGYSIFSGVVGGPCLAHSPSSTEYFVLGKRNPFLWPEIVSAY